MMSITSTKSFKIFKEYLLISFGVFLYAFSWEAFMIPQEISGGGLTGLSSILHYATGLPVSLYYLVINVCLIGIGTLVLGNAFGFKTIYAILLASLLFQLLPQWEWVTSFSDIPEKFINGILCGGISAIGLTIIFVNGGSTGGTDVLALILSKFYEISPGRVYLFSDMMIIASILLLPGKGLQDVIYGYIQMVTFSYMVDALLTGSKQSVQIFIFSSKFKEVADMLITKMDRGVTALHSEGWYSHQESRLLVVVARKEQLNQIKVAIMEVDPKAFIMVSSVMGVYGRGFDQIKGHRDDKKKFTLFKGKGSDSKVVKE